MARLKIEQRQELVYLYRDEGWRVNQLARKFDIQHPSVVAHLQGIERKIKAINYCPDEIVEKSAHVSRLRSNRPRDLKTYEDYLVEEERQRMKKREACGHGQIAIICICCGQHLEETRNQKAKARVVFIH